MTTPRPDNLVEVQFSAPRTLKLEFADSHRASLPIRWLQMPVDSINWSTARVSVDGTAMLIDHVSGGTVPIDAAAVRCMVDESFAANARSVMDVLQMTREVRDPVWSTCPSLLVDGAVVRVGRTRVSLDTVVKAYESRKGPEAIVRAYDSLALEDVRAAIAFYERNREAVRAYIERRHVEAEALQTRIEAERPRIPRQELLARRSAKRKAHAAARQ
jgi:uncharacterized protein (DUF433 family)